MSFGNTTAEFGQAANQWQKMMVDSWGQWTKNTVSSESFAAASGAYMDWTLSTQKMMAEMSGQVMETLDMPRRSDLARLAAQVQSVETRLLDQEEANEDIRELLVSLNAKLDRLADAQSAPSEAPAPLSVPESPETAPRASATIAAERNPVTSSALKEAITQAVNEVEVLKAPRGPRKAPKKGKK